MTETETTTCDSPVQCGEQIERGGMTLTVVRHDTACYDHMHGVRCARGHITTDWRWINLVGCPACAS